MNTSGDLVDKARELIGRYRRAGLKIALAESCTGGLVGAYLTEIPGASDVFDRGFVTYSNESKTEALGVSKETLWKHGAVSEAVAVAMADGALAASFADVALSITGIAGPDGGTANKPVGLVYFAVARRGGSVRSEQRMFNGDRSAVRLASVRFAFDLLLDVAGDRV